MDSKIKLLPRPNNTLKSYTRHARKSAFLVLQPCGKVVELLSPEGAHFAHYNLKPVTTATANEVAKTTDVLLVVYKEYFSSIVNTLNTAAENQDPCNTDSKLLVSQNKCR